MIGHLGSRVSALLDGRLSAAEEEKAWEHVHLCHFCRDLVEREGWVKTQLASLAPTRCSVSDGFKSSLLAAAQQPLASDACDLTVSGWVRHRGVLVLGSSAAGVAFLGVAALSGVFNPGTVDRRPTMTTIDQAVSPSSSGTNRPVSRHRPGAAASSSPTATARPSTPASASPTAPASGAAGGRASLTPPPTVRPVAHLDEEKTVRPQPGK